MKPFFENKNNKITLSLRNNNLGFKPHFHNYIEVVYLINGKCPVTLNGESFILNEGEVFIAFPNQVHSYTNDYNHSALVAIFSPDLIKRYKERFYSWIPEKSIFKADENFEKLFSLFLNEFEYVSDEVKEGYLCALISKVLEKLTLKKETADSSNILKSVIKYCKENYEKDISLEKLAEELNVSKFYLSHIFSDKINISFKDYINSLRVEKALSLLEETDFSITEISELCGFNTVRTFNRAFRKNCNTTPVDYRKNSSVLF